MTSFKKIHQRQENKTTTKNISHLQSVTELHSANTLEMVKAISVMANSIEELAAVLLLFEKPYCQTLLIFTIL